MSISADWVFNLTAAALFAAVVALEVYRLRRGKPGRIRTFTKPAPLGIGDAVAEVELKDGRVVTAVVPACAQCLCRFRPGDTVLVAEAAGRLIVTPPLRKTTCKRVS